MMALMGSGSPPHAALWPGTVLRHIAVPGYLARLQQCDWPHPNVYEFQSPETVLVLTQTALPRVRRTSFRARGERTEFLDPGDLVLMPKGVRVLSDSDGGRQRAFCLTLDGDRPETARLMGQDWGEQTLRSCMNVSNVEVKRSMQRLAREIAAPGLAAASVIEGLGMYITAELGQALQPSLGPRPPHRGGLSPAQLRRIDDYIHDHLSTSPTVSELAVATGFSRRHLARAFKQSTGRTLSSHIEALRNDEATRLICHTRLPLKEVSALLGYGSTSSFSTAYRRATGIPPGQMRQSGDWNAH